MKGGEWLWFAGIMVLGLVLRLIRLGDRDYWNDEVYNVYQTRLMREILLEGEHLANHPPGFSFVLTIFRVLGVPEGEPYLRLVPVGFGMLTMIMVFLVARRFFGTRAGLFAGFLMAISPMAILHSQDLKPYVALPLTGTITVYFLYCAIQSNRKLHWFCYGLFAGLACWSELFALQLLISINLWAAWQILSKRDRWKGWLVANIFGATLFLPFLGVMVGKVDHIIVTPEVWWIPPPSFTQFLFYCKSIAFGYSALDPLYKIATAWFGVFGLFGTVIGFKANRRATVLLLLWFLLSVALTAFLSWYFQQSIFLYRAMMPYAMAAYVLVGFGASQLPKNWMRGIGAAVFVGLAVMPLYEHYNEIYTPHEHPHRPGIHPPVESQLAADHILNSEHKDDEIIITSYTVWTPFHFYGIHESNMFHASLSQEYIDIQTGLGARNSPDPMWDTYFAVLLEPYMREDGPESFWFIYSDWEREYYQFNTFDVWRWIDSNFHMVDHATFKNIEVYRYTSKRDGDPITPLRRDKDNGVTAEMTYSAGEEKWTYQRTNPDAGLVASPPEDRAGLLDVALGSGTALELESRSEDDMELRIDWVASDVLVDFASFTDTSENTDWWYLDSIASFAGEDILIGTPVAEVQFTENAVATLKKELQVPAGSYSGEVFYRLPEPGTQNGRLTLVINGQSIPIATSDEYGWAEIPELTTPDGRLSISVTAEHTGAAGSEFTADIGFLSLRTDASSAKESHGVETLAIPWGEWMEVEPDMPETARQDYWVYDGETRYHVFRIR